MSVPYRIEGYVITCGGGMIADASAVMPEALKIEADHQFLERELDRFDVLVHGRHSHEGQPNSPRRRRLVVTRKIPTITPDPDRPKSLLWNPAGASFIEACGALALAAGSIAILGGTHVYDMFLEIGYDAFHMSRAGKAKLPGGTPVFSSGQIRPLARGSIGAIRPRTRAEGGSRRDQRTEPGDLDSQSGRLTTARRLGALSPISAFPGPP